VDDPNIDSMVGLGLGTDRPEIMQFQLFGAINISLGS